MIDKDKLLALKTAHGDDLHNLGMLEGVEVVVKAPNGAIYERYQSMLESSKTKRNAAKQLVVDCAVHPAGPELAALLDRRPFLVDVISNEIADIGGLGAKAQREKL